jgi:hypothetical protein
MNKKTKKALQGDTIHNKNNPIGRLAQVLKIAAVSKPVFKLNGNFDFNMGNTMFLTKGPTARHVYERTQHFLQNDPDL